MKKKERPADILVDEASRAESLRHGQRVEPKPRLKRVSGDGENSLFAAEKIFAGLGTEIVRGPGGGGGLEAQRRLEEIGRASKVRPKKARGVKTVSGGG
eukprot:2679178-Pleurochrysis_carterae.AAC.1